MLNHPSTLTGALVLALLCPRLAFSDAIHRVYSPSQAPADVRLQKLRDLDSTHPWRPIEDPRAWAERAQEVRQRILVAAGLWPLPPAAPLNPVIHGPIQRDGYTVEKVFFSSYPGFYVTGNLYRPAGRSGPLPAVLSPHGHWQNGRFYRAGDDAIKSQLAKEEEKTENGARYPLQARCAMLARLGCAVFFYDMAGYADSTQIKHTEGFQEVSAELRLQSFFGLQTWNSIRALDFLSSLPEVDPSRIGVTGASGGGTQTFILCAIDPRPAAAFPAVMVSTAMQGGCICENASHLRVGSGNIEFAAMCAPRPLGMTGANDWTLEIETKGLPELKALYRAFGAEDLVMGKCFPSFPHNYNQASRELMYSWMNRHLNLGAADPVEEKPFEPIDPKDLAVFDQDHPRPQDAVDAAALRRYMTAVSDRQWRELWPRAAWSLKNYREVVGAALKAITATRLPEAGEVEDRALSREMLPGPANVTLEKHLLSRPGSGEEIPAIVLAPAPWNGAVLVFAHPEGKKALWAGEGSGLARPVAAALESGAMVIGADVFRTGELNSVDEDPMAKRLKQKYAGYVFGYNRSVLANRTHDLLTTIAFARSRARGSGSIRLAGYGRAGIWAALARALAGNCVARTLLEDDGFRFKDLASMDDPMMLSGALKYGDVPGFLALCAPGELILLKDGAQPDLLVSAAYLAAGAIKNLRALPREKRDSQEALEWLLISPAGR
ncbi:MAG: acetylxylan esterase [Planctomycetes bacterium]|nr:acetylxylan esterase [Planctomycetota bacterium]